jgi:hypothetical protein
MVLLKTDNNTVNGTQVMTDTKSNCLKGNIFLWAQFETAPDPWKRLTRVLHDSGVLVVS